MEEPRARSRHPVSSESVERLSISVSGEDKSSPEIATEKKVSLAWVIRLSFLALVAIGTSACATDATGQKETIGEALQRMDGSIENTISRLQDKRYQE